MCCLEVAVKFDRSSFIPVIDIINGPNLKGRRVLQIYKKFFHDPVIIN